MPNIIELNLLSNKSIVATMQGYPLANENSYKIIAGEENSTKFIIKSPPPPYQTARLTVEMVNAKGFGIAETELSEIEVDLVSYKGFILPVGMAVAGYGYVSIKAYLDNSSTTIENGTVSVDYTKLAPYTAYTFIYNGSAWELNKNVVNLSTYGITISGTPKENDIIQVREKVVFQPLKLKVWNTIPQWQDYVDKTANVKVVDGYLILTENGNEYNLGYVQGEKGADGITPDMTDYYTKAETDANLANETRISQEQSINLLDPATAGERGVYYLNGKWYQSGGTDYTKNSRAYILDVKPNTAYAWATYKISSGYKYGKNLYGGFVDADGNFISACHNVWTATTPENAAQIILQFTVFAGNTVEEATEQFVPMIVEGSEPPSKYVEYIPPYKTVKEEIDRLSGEVAILQNSNEIRAFNLVNPVVKKYMDEVEYDNDDYSYSYIGQGDYIYNAEGKQYTPNKLYRTDRPLPVVLKWAYDENAVSISVLVSTSKYLTEPLVILPEQKTHSRAYQVPCGASKIAVYNLLPNTTYYYKVVALYAEGSEAVIKTDNFTTAIGKTRMLAIDGVDNVRDIGGYTVYNSEGVATGQVKYERIYRGAALDEDSFHGRKITDNGVYELIRQVGVRAELDLRGNKTKATSPIGADLEKADDFLSIPAQSYLAVFSDAGKSATKEAFEFILAKLNDDTALDTSDYKPVYIHCQGGADRTGCLIYLLLGVLGVNENDLCKEWELTSFGCQGYRVRCSTSMNLQGFVAQLKTYAGNTFNEKIENFLLECGISSADIEDFRANMITVL